MTLFKYSIIKWEKHLNCFTVYHISFNSKCGACFRIASFLFVRTYHSYPGIVTLITICYCYLWVHLKNIKHYDYIPYLLPPKLQNFYTMVIIKIVLPMMSLWWQNGYQLFLWLMMDVQLLFIFVSHAISISLLSNVKR